MIGFSLSLKTSKGLVSTPHNMLLNVLAKMRPFEVFTFFLTCSTAEFFWTEIIKVVACQYVKILTDGEVYPMDWSKKVNYIKRKLVTAARKIDCAF